MSPLSLLLGLALAFLPVLGTAQSSTTRGPYTIHYSALPSTLITPEVARNSGLTRSASRGLLNIAIIKKEGEREFAVTATIDAAATNPAGQRQSLRMREVREGDAIYYLGEPRISDGERLDFELRISPEGAGEPILLRFAQSFHP
jgi:hypothetical protein